MTVEHNIPLFRPGSVLLNTPLLKRRVREATDNALEDTAVFYSALLKSVTPVKTGALRAGWNVKKSNSGLEVTNPVPYAVFLERGTTRMRARNMVGSTQDKAISFFRERLRSSLGRGFTRDLTAGIHSDPVFTRMTAPVSTFRRRR